MGLGFFLTGIWYSGLIAWWVFALLERIPYGTQNLIASTICLLITTFILGEIAGSKSEKFYN